MIKKESINRQNSFSKSPTNHEQHLYNEIVSTGVSPQPCIYYSPTNDKYSKFTTENYPNNYQQDGQ